MFGFRLLNLFKAKVLYFSTIFWQVSPLTTLQNILQSATVPSVAGLGPVGAVVFVVVEAIFEVSIPH
jgi:hypothetical protein